MSPAQFSGCHSIELESAWEYYLLADSSLQESLGHPLGFVVFLLATEAQALQLIPLSC